MAFGRVKKQAEQKEKRPKVQEGDHFPVVDFDPVKAYVEDLRVSGFLLERGRGEVLVGFQDKFDRYALFFHDACGGNVIGVLWRPRVTRMVDEKVCTVCVYIHPLTDGYWLSVSGVGYDERSKNPGYQNFVGSVFVVRERSGKENS